jgi:glycosyltransferase involved in cell wall biosynthesis
MSVTSHATSRQGRAEESSHAPAFSHSVLIVAWEFPRFHSRQGSALARRIGQIARGLARAGWRVSVVHPRQTADDPAASNWVIEPVDGGELRRRAVGTANDASRALAWPSLFRKAATTWSAFRYGDRSGRWADDVVRLADDGALAPHSLVIGCFTPRGPLRAAASLHRMWNVPWIADLQDPWWEGSSRVLRPLVAWWMRRTLRSAASVTQVSPEWAAQDGGVLRRRVEVLRHAVPAIEDPVTPTPLGEVKAPFQILYAGSLNEDCQNLDPLMDALKLLRTGRDSARRVLVQVAGSDSVWRKFADAAAARGISDSVESLGWLTEAQLARAVRAADALLLIPWFPAWRQGVPSKMFEYIAFAKPTLVAGIDSGGISSLLAEWGHPAVIASRPADIAEAIRAAVRGDTSLLVEGARCRNLPLSERALGARYAELAESIINFRSRREVSQPCPRST